MIREDRPAALDHLGFASQLVFTTTYLAPLRSFDLGEDVELAYAMATGPTTAASSTSARSTGGCCRSATCPSPTSTGPRRRPAEAIELGAKALMIASQPAAGSTPRATSASTGCGPRREEAGRPILFHVGGEQPMNPVYKNNGLPPVPDFHGGDTNFTSVSYMAIPYAPMQTLATLIFDGVFDRFPELKFGAIELGASWLPGWMRAMDSAAGAFVKNEERLQQASLTPSEFVRRQLRVTPYPHEDAGWIIEQLRSRGGDVLLGLPPRRGRPEPDEAVRDLARGLQRPRSATASSGPTSTTSWARRSATWTGRRGLDRSAGSPRSPGG